LKKLIIFFAIAAVALLSLTPLYISWMKTEKETIIGISKASGSGNYHKYAGWLQPAGRNIKCIDLSVMSEEDLRKTLPQLAGILISGGPDVHPSNYGMDADTIKCETIEPERDKLEFELINYAISNKVPLLGICRGLQIINVYLGGTLFADIRVDYPGTINHRKEKPDTAMHKVQILESAGLRKIVKTENETVNSFHHQGINKLAEDLAVNAKSEDGLIEGIEWKNTTKKGFLMAVQWHPERMNFSDKLSGSIALKFVYEASEFRK